MTDIGLILHIATSPYLIAIIQNGAPLAVQSGPITRPITDHLMTQIQQVVATANLALSDLKFITTTLGPGGYTSTRIGITTAKSIAMALDIPIYGLSTLEAYVWAHIPHNGVYLSLLEPRADHYSGQLFRIHNATVDPLSAPCTWTAPQLLATLAKFTTPIIVVGDVSNRITPEITICTVAPTSISFHALAHWLNSEAKQSDFNKLMPIYAYEVS